MTVKESPFRENLGELAFRWLMGVAAAAAVTSGAAISTSDVRAAAFSTRPDAPNQVLASLRESPSDSQVAVMGEQNVGYGMELPSSFQASLRAIHRLGSLPENWDSYGSPPLETPAVQGGVFLLRVIESEGLPAPDVSPVSGGGIQLEWWRAGRGLELEIMPDGSVDYLRVFGPDNADMSEGSIPTYMDQQVREELQWFAQAASDGDVAQ